MSNQGKEREQYKVEFPVFDFHEYAASTLVSSDELCRMAKEYFDTCFADCEGVMFDMVPGTMPTMSVLFNHEKYDENTVVACQRIDAKSSGNNLIDKTRRRDHQMIDGDRYYLTDDGKDIFAALISYSKRKYNHPSKAPEWGMVVGEYTPRTNANRYFTAAAPQYTKVSSIDLNMLCTVLFGDVDENGEKVEYQCVIKTANTNANGNANVYDRMYMNSVISNKAIIEVQRINCKEMENIYREKFGYNANSDGIFR